MSNKTPLALAILVAFTSYSQANDINITTTSGDRCIAPFKLTSGGQDNFRCVRQNGRSECATAVDTNNVATQFGECSILESCPTTEWSGPCQQFTYNGQTYPAGTCIFEGSTSSQNTGGWCATSSSYSAPGSIYTDWDFCNCDMTISPTSSASDSYDYTDPNNDWCNVAGSQCCSHSRQTPIDIITSSTVYNADYANAPLSFSTAYWEYVNSTVSNNGHNNPASIISDKNLTITGGPLGCEVYKLLQFHFHWSNESSTGSEHTVNGNSYPLEVHLVHMNTKYPSLNYALGQGDGLAVIGIFFEIGNQSDFVSRVEVNITHLGDSVDTTFRMADLLSEVPNLNDYTSYLGSLTTPGCNPSVIWINILSPATVAESQLVKFRTYLDSKNNTMAPNYRPIQPLNGRTVYRSCSGTP